MDKLINQLEKKKSSLTMKTLEIKYFKNALNPKFAFFDCPHNLELKDLLKKPKRMLLNCDWKSLSKY